MCYRRGGGAVIECGLLLVSHPHLSCASYGGWMHDCWSSFVVYRLSMIDSSGMLEVKLAAAGGAAGDSGNQPMMGN